MRVERVMRHEQPIVGIHQVIAIDDLSDFLGRAYGCVSGELARLGLRPSGPPVALYAGDVSEKVDVVAGFPVTQLVLPGEGFVATSLPGGAGVETVHHGTYDEMGRIYVDLLAWLAERDLEPARQTWEEYLAGPDTEADPARWCTRIVYPLA